MMLDQDTCIIEISCRDEDVPIDGGGYEYEEWHG
jgi:hypothetical protein